MVNLKPPTFEEFLVVETYKDSYKASLTSLNGSCEKIVTAAFSIATAYGALIALVKPADDVPGWVVASPIIILTIAAVLGLIGHSRGISELPTNEYEKIEGEIKGVIDEKRCWVNWAIGALAVAVVWGGVVTYVRYAEPAPATTPTVEVSLSKEGQARLKRLCGKSAATVTAQEFAIDETLAVLKKVKECGEASISIPGSLVVGARTQ